jgi:hypothetical protein
MLPIHENNMYADQLHVHDILALRHTSSCFDAGRQSGDNTNTQLTNILGATTHPIMRGCRKHMVIIAVILNRTDCYF